MDGPPALLGRYIPSMVTTTINAESAAKIANMTSAVDDYGWVIDVDLAILVLTVVGSLSILTSMAWLEFRGRPATTRMRLVQSLVLSDLIMGIVGMIGSAIQIKGRSDGGGLKAGTDTCKGLGLVLVAVLWTEHVWTLLLAVATFLILIHPLHFATLWLEKKWYWLWLLVWLVSIGVGIVGLEVYGYVPSGGICYYPTSAGLYGELIQFIPRGMVFVTITFLYARLFVFLRRPDRIRASYSDPSGVNSTRRSSLRNNSTSRKLSALFNKLSGEKAPVVIDPVNPKAPPPKETPLDPETRIHSPVMSPDPPPPPPVTTPMSEIPPWERVELPPFQVDGQRYGGSAANHPSSTSLWGNWKGLGGGNAAVRDGRSKRPSQTSSYSPPTQSVRQFGSASSQIIQMRQTPSSHVTPRFNSIPSVFDIPPTPPADSDQPPQTAPASHATFNDMGRQPHRRRSGDLSSSIALSDSGATTRKPSATPSYAPTLGSAISPGEGTPRKVSAVPSLTPSQSSANAPDAGMRRESVATGSSEPSSNIPSHPINLHAAGSPSSKTPLQPFPLPSLSDRESSHAADPEAQRDSIPAEEEENEDEWDLMRVLQSTQPPNSQDDRFAPAAGESVEFVQESMASYLNRKTALLMLWFPLGYVLLFSVSLIRIIYDFNGNPPTVLRAISRWMIFSQGILDALIYGLVEWHTKRAVRRKVRKGTFSPSGSRSPNSGSQVGSGIASAIRGAFSGGVGGGGGGGTSAAAARGDGSYSMTGRTSQTGGGGEVRSRPKVGQGATVSFGPIEEDPRSILQELEGAEGAAERKGSLAGSSGLTVQKEEEEEQAWQGRRGS